MEFRDTQHSLDCSNIRDTLIHLLIYPLNFSPGPGFQKLLEMLQYHGALKGVWILRVFCQIVQAPAYAILLVKPRVVFKVEAQSPAGIIFRHTQSEAPTRLKSGKAKPKAQLASSSTALAILKARRRLASKPIASSRKGQQSAQIYRYIREEVWLDE